MLFNSAQFLLFFPIVTILYFLLPHKFRWLHLLLASCVFYMAFIPVYIFILFFTIIIDYYAGIMIEGSEGKKRKLYLIVSLIANIGILAVFKYYNFFINNFNSLLHLTYTDSSYLPLLNIILPIGLSFHTFQAMSYTIEVYRGNHPAERHFGIYSLYVMFYPQLVAGPIERPQNLLHQFHEKHYFDTKNVIDGLKLMAWGMFKKVVIADRLAAVTDPVFNNPQDSSTLSIIIAAIFFSFQIYCDFSGYSDIALGAARVMGFRLMKNFNNPNHATNISNFWSRWHISLSTWFRDYLYIPMGGNRVSVPRWYLNLFTIFLVSGLWHGANWTFIVWGALHGFYVLFALMTKRYRKSINDWLGISKKIWLNTALDIVITFMLVALSRIFFRSSTISNAFYMLKRIFTDFNVSNLTFKGLGITVPELLFCIGLMIFLELVQVLQTKRDLPKLIKSQPVYVRWPIYYAFIFVIIYLGVYESRNFIYFQF